MLVDAQVVEELERLFRAARVSGMASGSGAGAAATVNAAATASVAATTSLVIECLVCLDGPVRSHTCFPA